MSVADSPTWDDLDPGIRDIVRALWFAGFETTDSGDGLSKADAIGSGEALNFRHVAASTPVETMVAEAERMAGVLGEGWVVEASYSTLNKTAILFAYGTAVT